MRDIYNALLTTVLASRPPGFRLPPVRELCRTLHCSPYTLKKALDRLAHEGVVHTVPGGGSFVGNLADLQQSTTSSTPPPPLPGWQRIRQAILDDIHSGIHASGVRLEPMKLLSRRYSTGFRTLNRALDALTQSGILGRQGKSLVVNPGHTKHVGGRLVFIAPTDEIGLLSAITPRTQEMWRTIEYECSRLNVRLEIVSGDNMALRSFRKKLLAGEPVLGFILYTVGYERNELAQLIMLLAPLDLPVSIIDEIGSPGDLPIPRSHASIRVFLLGTGPGAGTAMARYLLALGHRSVAYLNPDPDTVPVEARYRGLTNAFDMAGIVNGVCQFSSEEYHDRGQNPVSARIDQAIRMLTDDPEIGFSTLYDQSFPALGSNLAQRAILRKTMHKAFETLLQHPGVTAWVAYNDLVAFAALDFLKSNQIRLPEQLSLISFDDTIEAFGNGVTSYNFNVTAVLKAAIEHIISPGTAAQYPAGPIEVPGIIMRRRSSGPAPS